ncbi:MAG: hypothetical protein KHZ72_11640 [Lachnospiraceae bacterium]|nr:hypothetical protein [Lachnospiraceae bacterium]
MNYKDDFTIGKDGVPICKAGRKINHDGSESSKARLKFRCPLAIRKYGCSCSVPYSDSKFRRSASAIYAAYHNLWRIEESFCIMKSQLDARSVFIQKQETITGHFLVCYLSVLLTRLFQIHILKDEYSTEESFDFIRHFRIAKISDRKYII